MAPSRRELYYDDFYAWTQAQAKELRRFARTRPDLPPDLAHIAEEIQDLGKGKRDAAFDLAERIVGHFPLATHWPGVSDRRLRWLDEVDHFRNGGILHRALRRLLLSAEPASSAD